MGERRYGFTAIVIALSLFCATPLKFRLLNTVYTKHDKRLFPREGKNKERQREKILRGPAKEKKRGINRREKRPIIEESLQTKDNLSRLQQGNGGIYVAWGRENAC
jgi:hypothetical protein